VDSRILALVLVLLRAAAHARRGAGQDGRQSSPGDRRPLIATAAALTAGLAVGLLVAGATAAGGAVKHTKVVERTFLVKSGQARNYDLHCPAGYVAVGGGGHVGGNAWPVESAAYAGIAASDVDVNREGWTITAFVTSLQGNTTFTGDVVCATWSN
jgi:hypothetical protein